MPIRHGFGSFWNVKPPHNTSDPGLTPAMVARTAAVLALHVGRVAWKHKPLGAVAGKGLRWFSRASGYAGALHAWMEFAGDRRTALFLKASATSGLAVARIHPVLNLSLAALSFTNYPDRAFEVLAERMPSTGKPAGDAPSAPSKRGTKAKSLSKRSTKTKSLSKPKTKGQNTSKAKARRAPEANAAGAEDAGQRDSAE